MYFSFAHFLPSQCFLISLREEQRYNNATKMVNFFTTISPVNTSVELTKALGQEFLSYVSVEKEIANFSSENKSWAAWQTDLILTLNNMWQNMEEGNKSKKELEKN